MMRPLAPALGIKLDDVSIAEPVDAVESVLGDLFKGTNADLTEENIQSRLRGTLLMAVSNKFGHMVVTTGNKSEVSVGYATLYGDMNGGYNPIKDIYKTEVFALARWRNENLPSGGLGLKALSFRKTLSTNRPAPNCAPTKKTKTACRLMMRWTIFFLRLSKMSLASMRLSPVAMTPKR